MVKIKVSQTFKDEGSSIFYMFYAYKVFIDKN